MAVELEYCLTVPPGDPQKRPVRFIGKLKCLKDLKWSQVSDYLTPRVDQRVRWPAILKILQLMTILLSFLDRLGLLL